jgi:alkanesulfonate monooxygenase SsuD/methylene tetrahydromethanopterin reductase-like flavin-dependent oxidoreductase (luciferase family)
VWLAGSVGAALQRAGRHFDGWFANEPDLDRWRRQWQEVQQAVRESGRDPGGFVAAVYLTVAIDDVAGRAEQRLDAFLENYYGQPAAMLRGRQACYAGSSSGAAAYLQDHATAGAGHLILRFTGEHERNLETLAALCGELGW